MLYNKKKKITLLLYTEKNQESHEDTNTLSNSRSEFYV